MSTDKLQAENEELRYRLEEAEETLRAIQRGAVDAFVVEEPTGHKVYTLEAADRPYRLFVEQMQQGAATIHADGTIAYCNRQLAELLRVAPERLVGASLHDFVAPADRGVYDNLLWQGQNRTGRGEAQLRRSDGALVPAYLTFNVLPKDCGAAMGVLVTDLTAQRHHDQLTAVHEALRTSEGELRKLADNLSDADRHKDEFLAMLAHELKNPLAPIHNAVQILRLTEGATENVRSATQVLDRQAKHMARLVDDLLDVSRISRGKIELRRERIELASVVDQAVEAARPVAERREHELVVVLPPEPVLVDADGTRLAQVLGNLLGNAFKFTQNGGRIRLVVERQGQHALIRVQDNGIGIGADQLPRIFEMFTQVDSALERAQTGLGIGLTLAKNLVEMHGGTLAVHSAGVGQGSEFIVRLPIIVDMARAPRPKAAAAPTASDAARRVLVVDDNRDSATSLAMLLEMAGHETCLAHDGLEAVEQAAAFNPELVLLDIGLPKLNGYQAARKIRELPVGKDMVLVAITGWGQEDARRQSREAGFDIHMVKPVDYSALMNVLATLPPGSDD